MDRLHPPPRTQVVVALRTLIGPALALATLAVGRCGSERPGTDDSGTEGGQASSRPLSTGSPGELRVKSAYVGVACRGAGNHVGCDRVCAYVALRQRPAGHIRMTLGGHELRLPHVHRNAYEACLRKPGLLHEGPLAVEAEDGRWRGTPPVSVPARIEVCRRGRSDCVERDLGEIRLSAGYG